MQIGILEIAVGVVEVDRGAVLERAGVPEGPADRALHPLGSAVAHTDARGCLELIGRVLGADDDRAADGVASVQGALRPLQDLDLLDVEEFLVELIGIAFQHSVDQHRDRRFAVTSLRDAAHGDERVACVLRLDDRHVRDHRDEVARVRDPGLLDRLLRYDVHRDRHVAKGLIAFARRHNDLFQLSCLCQYRQCPNHGPHRGH